MSKAIKHKTVTDNTANTKTGTRKLKSAKTQFKARIKVKRKQNVTQAQTQLLAQTLNDAKHLYPTSKENIIEATPVIANLINDLKRLEELKKQLLFQEDAIKLKVMNYMQDHSTLKHGDSLLASWKTQTRHTFDLPAFKDEYHSLYESFLKESSIRVFRLL